MPPPTDPSDPSVDRPGLTAGSIVGGRFRLQRRLGHGLSGETWMVDDSASGDSCALKVSREPGEGRSSWVALRAEARRLRSVVHPNVARFRAAVFEPETPMAAVATELAEGPTVHEAAGRGKRPRGEALGLLVGCARGLGALHAADLVHRDLQPRNVVLVDGGKEPSAVVIDLGLAASRPATPRGALVGTLGFVAPEVVLEGRGDARSDLYSLGAVLFYLLTGQPPVEPSQVLGSIVRGMDPFQEAERRAREVLPRPFAALAARLLARHPHARFQEASEVVAAVNAAFSTRFALDSAAARRPALARPVFVGRTTEVRRAVRHLRTNLDAGGALLVRGPAGSGRSRFLEEVARPLSFRGYRVVEVRAGSADAAPLAPLAAGLGAVRHRLPESSRALLDRAGEALAGGPGNSVGRSVRAGLMLREAVVDAAAASPFVLAVDDGERLDEFTLDLVRRCAEAAAEGSRGPTILLALPEEGASLPVPLRLAARALKGHPRSHCVALGALSRAAADDLVRGLLPAPLQSKRLLERIADLAAGVPAAVVEVVQGILGAALVRKGGKGWTVRARTGDLPVPRSLQAAGRARLDPLAAEQRDALLGLAISGGPAERAAWAAVRREAGLTPAQESDLRRRGLLARDGRDGAASIPAESVRRLLLEGCARERLRRWASVLAGAVPAGTPAAVRLLLDAGRGSQALEGGESALRFLREHRRLDAGLALAGRLVEEARRHPSADASGVFDEAGAMGIAAERLDLAKRWVEEGVARKAAGPQAARVRVRWAEVRAFAEEDPSLPPDAIPHAPTPEHAARLAVAAAQFEAKRGSWETSGRILEGALRTGSVPAAVRARLLNGLAAVQIHLGDLEDASGTCERAAAAMRDAGDESGLLVVLLNLARLEVRRAGYRRGLRRVEDAERRLGPHVSAGEELSLATVRVSALEGLGRWAQVRAGASRALALAEELGTPASRANALRRLGRAEAMRGELETGLRLLTRSLRLARQHGLHYEREATKCALAWLYLMRGERTAARKCLRGIEPGRQPAEALRALVAEGLATPAARLAGIRSLREDPAIAAWPEERAALRLEEAVLLVETGDGERGKAALLAAVREAQRTGAADDLARGLLALESSFRDSDPATAGRARGKMRRLSRVLENAVLRAELLEALSRGEEDPVRSRRLREEAAATFARCSLPGRASRLDGGEAPPGAETRGLRPERMAWVLQHTARVNAAEAPEEVLAGLLDASLSLTGAERGFLVLATEGGYEVREARAIGQKEVEDRGNGLSVNLVRGVLRDGKSITTIDAGADSRFSQFESVRELRLRSILVVPILRAGRVLGAFYLDNRFVEGAFRDDDRLALEMLAEQAALAFENISYRARIQDLNEQLKERLSERERELVEVRTTVRSLERASRYSYETILRRGGPMAETLRVVDRAVESEIAVLLEGESGTGKELVARAIHLYGDRRARPFVVVNCAALPESLIESELFGHRKGAYTGAHADRRGQFEAADGGTLFLDEIGDLPLAMQPKLLRAVQFGEFVPLGSSEPSRADVRIVCATNRDLRAMSEKGEFRSDLYFRLAVLPIRLPALRERRQDIPLIAESMIRKYAAEVGKGPRRLHRQALARLLEHDWPGNVRELENVLRRAVLVAPGSVLHAEDLRLEGRSRADRDERVTSIAGAVPGGLLPREAIALARVLRMGRVTLQEHRSETGVSRATATRDLQRLVKARVLVCRGRTTATHYALDPRWARDASVRKV